MKLQRRQVTALSILAGVGFVAILFAPLLIKGISPVTQGVLLGIAGALCLIGIAYGIWDARRIEAKRKAKEQIWMKH